MKSKEEGASPQKLLRWSAAVILILIFILFDAALRSWQIALPQGIWIALDSLLLAGIGLLGFLLIERTLIWRRERKELSSRLADAEQKAQDAVQRQSAALRISQSYVEVSEETEVIELILQQSVQVVGARGASFVSLDERAQPLPPVTVGEMPAGVTDAWLEYLASPTVRQRCSSCSQYGHTTIECPLLGNPAAGSVGVYCLPFTRGEQQYGSLNLFLSPETVISEETRIFLQKIVAEATLAMEGIRMRSRELQTLHEIQLVREKNDLRDFLTRLLVSLNDTLESDFAQIKIFIDQGSLSPSNIAVGSLPVEAQHMVDGVLQTVVRSGKPVTFGESSPSRGASAGIRALMAAPLAFQDHPPLGAVLVASNKLKTFTPRQLSMLQTICYQAALVVHNNSLMSELEYNAILAERARLAREIHDGIAQTLAYLKLKLAQLKNYAEQGDQPRLLETLSSIYDTLVDAYGEVRGTIDGLRIVPDEQGLEGLLRQIAADFEGHSDVKVEFSDSIDNVHLPPEVQIQLVRIVQEALNNIRKHAGSSSVLISCLELNGDLVLEVRDDGKGFDLDDIPGPSQHGLRGMRERAEVVGADFQVTSQPLQGTIIRIRLPLEYVGDAI